MWGHFEFRDTYEVSHGDSGPGINQDIVAVTAMIVFPSHAEF